MGNKCCPRVGSVFLDFSPNKKPVHQSQSLGCVNSLEALPTTRVSNGDSCPWFRRHVLQPTTMTFVDQTQTSDLATPAMTARHSASHPVSSTDDPLGWRISRRVNASVFRPVHHGGESCHFFETSCSDIFDCFSCSRFPDSAIAFNKSVLPWSFGCREIWSNAMSFQTLTELSFEITSRVQIR